MPERPRPALTPGEAARRLGVTIRTLHRWEDAGKLTSKRTPGGQRRYNAEDIEALLTDDQKATA